MTSTTLRNRTAQRWTARVATVGIVALTGLGLTATAALAHHPEVQATLQCSGAVHAVATAWNGSTPESRTNASIDISYSVVGASSGYVLAAHGEFAPGNGFTFSRDFTVPGAPNTIWVKAHALASWGNGNPGGQDSPVAMVIPQGTCTPTPAAAIAAPACSGTGGSALVTLRNTGTRPSTFTVTGPGGALAPVTVAAGDSATVPVALAEDVPALILVSADGTTIAQQSVTADCTSPQPAAQISESCSALSVALSNPGGEDTVFTVAGGDSTRTVAVPAHTTTPVLVSVPTTEDTASTVTVTAPREDGTTYTLTQTVTTDCLHAQPAATVTESCSALTVLLSNPGTQSTVFTLTSHGSSTTVEVPARTTTPVAVPFPTTEDATTTVSVTAPGLVTSDGTGTLTRSVTTNCAHPQPSVTQTHDCTAQTLVLGNSGTQAVTFAVGDRAPITVAPSGSSTVTVAAPSSGDTSTAVVATAAGEASRSFGPFRQSAGDCVHATAPVETAPTQTAPVAVAPIAVVPAAAVAPLAEAPIAVAPVVTVPIRVASFTLTRTTHPAVLAAQITRANPPAATRPALRPVAAQPTRALAYTGAGQVSLLLTTGLGLLGLGGTARAFGRRRA